MLALPALAVENRDPVRLGRRAQPTGKPPSHPHQVRVVQLLLTVLVQPPPPHPKPARVMPQRKVRVHDDAIHAVIAARQQIPIALAELINHRGTRGDGHSTITPHPTLPRRGH